VVRKWKWHAACQKRERESDCDERRKEVSRMQTPQGTALESQLCRDETFERE